MHALLKKNLKQYVIISNEINVQPWENSKKMVFDHQSQIDYMGKYTHTLSYRSKTKKYIYRSKYICVNNVCNYFIYLLVTISTILYFSHGNI